jgi:hypothetical protein
MAGAVKAEDMKKVREVDFINKFTHDGINKLLEVLGVTNKIKVVEGETLYSYTNTVSLESGAVEEGAVIPLSEVEQTKTPVGTATLNKWRKATTAEAIVKSGKNEAVNGTDASLLKKVQAGVKANMFTFINGTITGSISATGVGLQQALANGWGELQVAFEDDDVETVFFLNPLDVADYLGGAQVTTQTAFGFSYIENFLGLGTAILSGSITQGTYIATAKQNIRCIYINMAGDLAEEFNMTTDETGLIGISSGYTNQERAQVETLVMSGVAFTVEYAGGVVKGTITSGE